MGVKFVLPKAERFCLWTMTKQSSKTVDRKVLAIWSGRLGRPVCQETSVNERLPQWKGNMVIQT